MDELTAGILTAGVGVLGTLVGVIVTQWRSDMRERNRMAAEERREKTRLAREAERERDARLFDHRRAAYLAVIEEAEHRQRAAIEAWDDGQNEPADEGMDDFSDLIAQVDLFGSKEAGDQAWRLLDVVRQMTYIKERSRHDSNDDMNLKFMDELSAFVNLARNDLGLEKRFPDPPEMIVGGESVRI